MTLACVFILAVFVWGACFGAVVMFFLMLPSSDLVGAML